MPFTKCLLAKSSLLLGLSLNFRDNFLTLLPSFILICTLNLNFVPLIAVLAVILVIEYSSSASVSSLCTVTIPFLFNSVAVFYDQDTGVDVSAKTKLQC